MNTTLPISASPVSYPRPEPIGGLTQWMRTAPFWVLMSVVLLTLAIGWVDDITGWEVSLFVFYAIPIALAVWWQGVGSGVFAALLSSAVWYLANYDVHPYETRFGFTWALLNRMCYFGLVIFTVKNVRSRQEADADHIRALEERRQLERDLVQVSEHEQQRIGQDLHDGLCQQLAAINLAVRALAEELQAQQLPAAQDAALIEESIAQSVLEARNMARGIFPVHVDHAGLSAALRGLAATTSRLTGVNITVAESGEAQIENPETSMHLYRIAQEAVANAVRHGGAQSVTIRLRMNETSLELLIEDDGAGLPQRQERSRKVQNEGMGLRTMRYRAQVLGAALDVLPRTGGGTVVSCALPISNSTDPKICPQLTKPATRD